MKTRRFSNAEIERVIEEELEIADDIPAPWPSEFEEASPPNSKSCPERKRKLALEFAREGFWIIRRGKGPFTFAPLVPIFKDKSNRKSITKQETTTAPQQ